MYSFQDVYIYLANYKPRMIQVVEEETSLTDVYFLTENNDVDSGFAYITSVSALLSLVHPPKNTHLIVLEDIHFPDELNQRLQEEKNISLILIQKATTIFELFNAVKTLFSTKQQFYKKTLQLYETLLNFQSMDRVIETMEAELQNPVILVDESFKIIQSSKNLKVTDRIWLHNIKTGYCSYEFITEVQKLKSFREAPANTEAFHVICHVSKTKKWVSKIYLGEVFAGYLVVPECHTALTYEQIDLLSVFSKIIAQHYAQRNTILNTSNSLTQEKLLKDLIEGKIHTPSELQVRLKWLGISPLPYKMLVTVRSISKESVKTKTESLQTQLKHLFPNALQIVYKDSFIMVLSSKEETVLSGDKKGRIEEILKEKQLCGVYSDSFTDLLDLSNHYKRIDKAQAISLSLSKKQTLLAYNDLKFYHLLDDFPDKEQLQSLCHPAVIKLLDYDHRNKTDYYQTLVSYLFNNQNLNATAELLFIHRNTMKYRLKKINELIQVDLNQGTIIFQLAYSIMILNYLELTESMGTVLLLPLKEKSLMEYSKRGR